MNKIRVGPWAAVACLFAALLLITACSGSPEQTDPVDQGSAEPPAATSSNEDATQETQEPGSDPESGTEAAARAQQDWQNSAHAASFVVDDQGNNNLCARCHSPKNWMPTLDDIPESCQACKFELTPPPPFIEEGVWENVSCLLCHQADKKGNLQPEVSWLEIPQLDEYASVESHSELCLKCHHTAGIRDHGEVSVGSGHVDLQCTECHSPHSSAATCLTGDCHPDLLSDMDVIPGHDEDHENVSCAACHDSAGWEVGPHPETGIWVTFSPWSLVVKLEGEDTVSQTGTVPFSSHDLGLEVNCARCHFADNPWGLTGSVEIP